MTYDLLTNFPASLLMTFPYDLLTYYANKKTSKIFAHLNYLFKFDLDFPSE
jgi:hypothetical protein